MGGIVFGNSQCSLQKLRHKIFFVIIARFRFDKCYGACSIKHSCDHVWFLHEPKQIWLCSKDQKTLEMAAGCLVKCYNVVGSRVEDLHSFQYRSTTVKHGPGCLIEQKKNLLEALEWGVNNYWRQEKMSACSSRQKIILDCTFRVVNFGKIVSRKRGSPSNSHRCTTKLQVVEHPWPLFRLSVN